jgi:hypothetical protein
MNDEYSRFRRQGEVEVNDVHDGIMLYRPADDSVHHLNASAAIVYELCDNRTRAELIDAVGGLLALDDASAATLVDQALTALTAPALVAL